MTETQTFLERRKQALRDEILDAAFEVFAERGYHDAGIAEIAARVGIGNSTFYRQFQSKRDILEHVVATVVRRASDAILAENAPSAASNLAEYRAQVESIASSVAQLLADLKIARMLLIQSRDVDADLEARIVRFVSDSVTVTAAYLDHGRELGYLRADLDSTATARAVIGLFTGCAYIGLDPTIDADARARIVEAAINLMFNGITSPAS